MNGFKEVFAAFFGMEGNLMENKTIENWNFEGVFRKLRKSLVSI